MDNQKKSSKAMNIFLWVAQIVLATIFLMAGCMKATQPIEKLTPMLPWTGEVPEILVRIIGCFDILGAIGLLLPSILRIKPQLTVWAAIGFATIMLFAIIFHISKGETSIIGINLFLAAIAGFIAWGRYQKAPIEEK